MQAPPKHLTAPAKAMWKRLLEGYELDDAAGLTLLQAACEAFDRAEQARKAIEADGAILKDRFGQLKPHPAVAIERDARGQLIGAIRALKLGPGEE